MTDTMLLEPDALREHMQGTDCLVVDVRHDLIDDQAGRRAYVQGHIPGAVFMGVDTLLSSPKSGRNGRHPLPDLAVFRAVLREAGIRPETLVVAYDAHGAQFASRLWWMLRWAGHDRVAVLNGGLPAWMAAGGTLQDGAQGIVPDDLPNRVQPTAADRETPPGMPAMDLQAVQGRLGDPAMFMVDARSEERYLGKTEPIDPVAGHIPGAKNWPNSRNIGPDGRFRAVDELRHDYQGLLQGRPVSQVVHSCGSGISACHNLFAMELAGLEGAALYAGSWSEWCADPARPVARGAE